MQRVKKKLSSFYVIGRHCRVPPRAAAAVSEHSLRQIHFSKKKFNHYYSFIACRFALQWVWLFAEEFIFFLIKAPVRCLMRQNHFIKKKLIVPLRAAMGVPVSSVRGQINSIKKNIMIFHYSSPFALQRVWLFAEEFIFFLTKAARRCRCLGCFRELPPLWKICQERPPR
jgi:hypothetical protein